MTDEVARGVSDVQEKYMANRRRKKRVNYGSGIGEPLTEVVNSNNENQGEIGILDTSLDNSRDSISFASDEDSSFSRDLSLNDSMYEDILDNTEVGLARNSSVPGRTELSHAELVNFNNENEIEMFRENEADAGDFYDVDDVAGYVDETVVMTKCIYHTTLDKVSAIDKPDLLQHTVFLILLALPPIWLLWNSYGSSHKFIPEFLSFTLQSVCILGFAVAFVIVCLIFISRKTPARWTMSKINDSLTYCGNDHQQSIVTRNKGIQTDARGGAMDVATVRKRCEMSLKRARRQYLKLKRDYSRRLAKLKSTSKQHSEFLSRLQLKFPDLEKERDLLIAEKEAIEKQHEEEKRRNRELIGRFQRLQQQLGRSGQRQMVNPY